MGAPNPNSFIWCPGRLAFSATGFSDVSTTWPHTGGTGLGSVADVVQSYGRRYFRVEDESLGDGLATEILFLGETWKLTFFLRGADEDALGRLFRNQTATGAGSGLLSIRSHPTAVRRSGQPLSDDAVQLLFTPDQPTRHRAIFIPRAIPLIEESAEIKLAYRDEAMIPVVFESLPHPTKACQQALLEDLSL